MLDNNISFKYTFVFELLTLDHFPFNYGSWKVILPPQTILRNRISHNDSFIVIHEGNEAFVRIHNSTEYSPQFNNLKPPKALVQEDLVKSLKIPLNKEVNLIFKKANNFNYSKELSLIYLETYDKRDENWKRLNSNKETPHSSTLDKSLKCVDTNKFDQMTTEKKLEWFSNSDNLSLFPPVNWYNSLLNGTFNNVIKSSLHEMVLFPGNVVSIKLEGYLSRFRVKSISNFENNGDFSLKIGRDSQILVSLDPEMLNLSYTEPSEPPESDSPDDDFLIYGMNQIIETLKTHVILPLLSESEVEPPSGVILYGPPGCGKTFLSRNISQNYKEIFKTEGDLGFKMVHSTDLISDYLGRTENNVNDMFKELREESRHRKVICFIDEIDVLCSSREDTTNSTNKRVLTTFLNNMDGLKVKDKNFVVIGLTNYVDSIDNALRRPGRFDLEIEVPVPSSENRLLILKKLLKTVKHNLNDGQVNHVNDFCQAFVGADLKLLITNANHAKVSRINRSDTSVKNEYSKPLETSQKQNHLTFEDFMDALKVTRPSAMRELFVEVPQVKWDDIGGYEDLKVTVKQSVEYPRRFSKLYEELHVQTPKGILLYGPPGCSKTMFAKAICTESHMNFISVKGPEIFNKYVGESERNIRRLFSKARLNSPCVIFFDEIDSICVEDSTSSSRRVLGTLLNEMDGITSLKNVLVIGATNRPQDISKSLLRPGRFDKLIYVPLPDFNARKSIFKINLSKLKVDFDIESTCHKLSELTNGFSGAEVVSVCRQSSMFLVNEVIESLERDKVFKSSLKTQEPGLPNDGITDNNASPTKINMDKKYHLDYLSDDFENLSLSYLRPLTYLHLEKALSITKPLTSQEMVSFYEDFSKNSIL